MANLKPHEETDEENFGRTLEALSQDPSLKQQPILVDRTSLVILDGHHRYRACLELGIERIPCVLVDYQSELIELESMRDDLHVSKDEVIRRGLSGELYPPKTTKHIYDYSAL